MKVGRMTLAGAVLAGAFTASAGAAEIRLSKRCAPGSSELTISGSGFSPDALVKITGLDTSADYALADRSGNFSEEFLTPPVEDFRAHPTTVVATDASQTAIVARAQLTLVQELFITNFPVAGRPSQRVRWLFAGFRPSKHIYGHFVYRNRVRRTYDYGVARGACGTVSVTAPRFPTRARRGRWYIQFDQLKRYNRGTKPRRETRVTVS